MIIMTYSEEQSAQARDFLDDLADAVAGVAPSERCASCGDLTCDHPDLVFGGLVPGED